MAPQPEAHVFNYRWFAWRHFFEFSLVALIPGLFCLVLGDMKLNIYGWAWTTGWVLFSCYLLWDGLNERIILGNGMITSLSRWGRIRAQIALNRIRPSSLISANGQYELAADSKIIRFKNSLNDVGILLQAIAEAQHGSDGTGSAGLEPASARGTYVNKISSRLMPLVWLLLGLLFYVEEPLHRAMRTHELPSFNSVYQQFGRSGLMLLIECFGFAAYYAYKNWQSVTVTEDEIIWRDWFYHVRLRVRHEELIPGTMNWTFWKETHFSVETTKGTLRWRSDMRDSVKLGVFIGQLAKQPLMPIGVSTSPRISPTLSKLVQ